MQGRNVLETTLNREEPKLQQKREKMVEKIFRELM